MHVSWYRDPFNTEIDPNAEEAEELAQFKVSNAMKLAFNNKTDDSRFWLSLHDSYPLLSKKASEKMGIFIEEQGATSVETLWKETMDHKSLRATALEPPMRSILTLFQICSTVLDIFHVAHFQNLVALYLSLNGMLP